MRQFKRQFRIKEYEGVKMFERVYTVQTKILGMWFTLKAWNVNMLTEPKEDEECGQPGYSRLCATELLDKLEADD